MIVNNYADDAKYENECASGEEMKAAFQQFNMLPKTIRDKCKIVSMDVKALYPSMRWDLITKAVKEMILNSKLEVMNVDNHEVGIYLATTLLSPDTISDEGLEHVVPKRVNTKTKKITINYLQDRRNDEKWIPGRKPGRIQKKRMLALAINVGVEQVMSQHTYKVGDVCYLQLEGGAIGLGI